MHNDCQGSLRFTQRERQKERDQQNIKYYRDDHGRHSSTNEARLSLQLENQENSSIICIDILNLLHQPRPDGMGYECEKIPIHRFLSNKAPKG